MNAKTILILLVILTYAIAGVCQPALHPELSFLSKSVSISQLRVEHCLQPIHGAWRNISFFEDSETVVKNTHREYIGNATDMLGGPFPPGSNYYLIAENVTTGEFIQCGYNSDSLFYFPDQGVFDGDDNKYYKNATTPTFSWRQLTESIGEEP